MTDTPAAPFARFAPPIAAAAPLRTAITAAPLRAAITAACRRPEPEAMAPLIAAARLPEGTARAIAATACTLITALRQRGAGGGVAALVKEYALSSQEGVALMCLAEALLRIPDAATRDALIRDKI
ncbi:MAG TPA: hypothetical protein VFF98_09790, partial [Novosphingobium sp.]|nr:hypothetical protein [Novosphingobium sp.]